MSVLVIRTGITRNKTLAVNDARDGLVGAIQIRKLVDAAIDDGNSNAGTVKPLAPRKVRVGDHVHVVKRLAHGAVRRDVDDLRILRQFIEHFHRHAKQVSLD